MAQAFGTYVHFAGGMNSGFDASGIQEDQYWKGVNITCRGGTVSPRPSFKDTTLSFQYDWDRDNFRQARFQGAAWFSTASVEFLLCVIGGVLYRISPSTGEVVSLSAESRNLSEFVDRCYFQQVETFMIVQDGVGAAIIVGSSSARLADSAEEEVPTGTIMAYGQGRLFVKVAPRAIQAGDINNPNSSEDVLKFKEILDLETAGSLAVNSAIGDITAMAFLANMDTSTGDGPLLVSGETGFMTFRVDYPRADWKTINLAKTQVSGVGASGPFSVSEMNSDLMFWSPGGLRSYSVLKSEITSSRRFVNLSQEARDVVRKHTDWLSPLVSTAVFDGRLLTTIGGEKVPVRTYAEPTGYDYCFNGILSLDFDQMAGRALEGTFAKTVSYDGVWTGVRPTQLVPGISRGVERCFVFGKDLENRNTLQELTKTITGLDFESLPIPCRLITRAFVMKVAPDFTDSPFVPKTLKNVIVWAKDVIGEVPMRVWLSTDGNQYFTQITEATLKSPEDSGIGTDGNPVVGRPQTFPRFIFPAPRAACDPASGNGILSGYDFQFAIEWDGMLRIHRLLFSSEATGERRESLPEASTRRPATGSPEALLNEEDFTYIIPASGGFNG